MTHACLQATVAYVDLALSRPERRAALLESYHFDINGQARAAYCCVAHTDRAVKAVKNTECFCTDFT